MLTEVTVVVVLLCWCFFMVLLVSVQGWRCCGDALVLAWCDGFKSLRRCGGADDGLA